MLVVNDAEQMSLLIVAKPAILGFIKTFAKTFVELITYCGKGDLKPNSTENSRL